MDIEPICSFKEEEGNFLHRQVSRPRSEVISRISFLPGKGGRISDCVDC